LIKINMRETIIDTVFVRRRSKEMRRISIPVGAVMGSAFAIAPTWLWAQAPSETDKYVYYGPSMMWGGGWGMMIFGPLFMILLLAIVIATAVLLVRWIGGPWPGITTPHMPQGPTPLDILKERFARGEIDKNEFEERRRVLGA
jgi:putative membrane protein